MWTYRHRPWVVCCQKEHRPFGTFFFLSTTTNGPAGFVWLMYYCILHQPCASITMIPIAQARPITRGLTQQSYSTAQRTSSWVRSGLSTDAAALATDFRIPISRSSWHFSSFLTLLLQIPIRTSFVYSGSECALLVLPMGYLGALNRPSHELCILWNN